MPKVVRWSIVLLAASVASLGGSGLAQPGFPEPLLRSALGAEIYRFFLEEFTDPDQRAHGLELVAAMQDGAFALQGSGASPGAFSTCASLLGAGSNPKLDGGGDLLTALPGGVRPHGLVADPVGLAAGLAPRDGSTIVIIDEFDMDALATSLGTPPLRLGAEGDYAPLWNALYTAGASDESHAGRDIPHGHLVAFHLLAQLAPASAQVEWSNSGEALLLTIKVDAGPQFDLHLFDIDFDDVDGIRRAIANADLASDSNVIVMSWGLVDCTLSAQYAVSSSAGITPPYATFVDYLKAALAAGSESEDLLRDLCSVFFTKMQAAVAPNVIDCAGSALGLLELGTIAAIAAMSAQAAEDVGLLENRDWDSVAASVFASAGNQGLPFPMPPAAWPGIVGAEACLGSGPQRASFSNAGSLGLGSGFGDQAVMARGGWFQSPVASDGADGVAEGAPLGYWGTSFAAPAAAMYYASTEGAWQELRSAEATTALPDCQP